VADWRARVDRVLERALPAADASPQRLHAAMRHAVLDGGKRTRPLLVYATGNAFGCDDGSLDAPAAAVELIHAYSLVHDDLPSMDDDCLRRGKPTVHVAFDEATAILAGDALQSLAFEQLASAPASAEVCVAMLKELAVAAGARGMCGGQALDIDATAKTLAIDALQQLHSLKTGALLRAAVRMGALAAGVDAASSARLDTFAEALGLAFQIRDDLLDVEGDSAVLGKTAGKDHAQDKATFPALIGVDASRARLRMLGAQMDAALEPFGARAQMLVQLGRQAITRDR
jgi:farnesyl diphosphate synthase